jgi:hypothetical protein
MTSRYLALAATLAVSLLAGCATPTDMALRNDTDTIQADAKPIYLMTATFRNDYKPSFQPKLIVVHVERPDAKDRVDRLNFVMDNKARDEKDTPKDGNRYLLRMQLPAGDYIVRGFTGFSGVFPIRGMYFAPLHADVKAPASGVYYLGHVAATVRERRETEFRAGPPIPLIDQAIAGFSGGSFDVEISDRLEADLPEFIAKFPALRTATIQKALLGPFDRDRAQKFWEAH